MKAKANFGYVDADMFKATRPGVRLKFELQPLLCMKYAVGIN